MTFLCCRSLLCRRDDPYLEKIIPICDNRDFRRLYSGGKSVVTPKLVIYYRKNRSGKKRIGITTSKKIGNAVMRNRSRRIIREAVRKLLPYIKEGYDIILVARGRTPFLKSTDIYSTLLYQCGKIGLLKEGADIKS